MSLVFDLIVSGAQFGNGGVITFHVLSAVWYKMSG